MMQQDQAGKPDGEPRVHPSAIVEDGAILGAGTVVGPYAYIGGEVTLGPGTKVHHHATIEGFTQLGRECEIFPYACVGMKTQDLKYRGGRPGLRAGDRNVFREFCTIHAATNDGEFTTIGDDCYFLAYTHVAHDCQLGNGIILSNNATLAGHVVVEDHAIVGGMSGVHQFCRIGTRAMIGGCSKVEKDIPPFLVADGQPALVRGVNRIGLQRAGFSEERLAVIKRIYKKLYRNGLNRAQAIEALAADAEAGDPDVSAFIRFAERSERGFARAPRHDENGG